MRSKILPALFPLALAAASGCIMMTQRFDLVYNPSVHATGGSGEIFLVKPSELHGRQKDGKGRWILGQASGGGGKFVTQDDIGGWVAGALVQELTEAGFTVRPVTELPQGAPKALETTILRIGVKHEATALGSAAPSELALVFKVHSGDRVKTLTLNARGDYSKTSLNFARQKSLSLEKALQSALEEALPEIVRTLEQGDGGAQ